VDLAKETNGGEKRRRCSRGFRGPIGIKEKRIESSKVVVGENPLAKKTE